jgi:hypoxanthine phosphoribosyltransferase
MQCELISWRQFDRLCHLLSRKLIEADYVPDMIVAIGRGGYIPGRILSDHLGVMNLTGFKIEHYVGPQKSRQARVVYPLAADPGGQRVLLVDDVSDSGDTFEVAIDHLRQHGQPGDLRTAVLHHKNVSSFTPDYYVKKVTKWRWITYPWAVTEDLASLIPQLPDTHDDIEQIQRELKARHRLRAGRQQIQDALWLLEQQRRGA